MAAPQASSLPWRRGELHPGGSSLTGDSRRKNVFTSTRSIPIQRFVLLAFSLWPALVFWGSEPAMAQKLRFGDRIALRSSHGKYLVAEADGNLNANRAEQGPWEKFTVVDPDNPQSTAWVSFGDLITLRSYHGKYVVAGSAGETAADRTVIGPWERWRIENSVTPTSTENVHFGNRIALKSFHSLYLVAEPEGITHANRTEIGDWERWELRQAEAWTDYYYDDADPCGTGCCNCPKRGRYDGANCFVAKVPPGRSPFIWKNNFYYSAGPGNSCPLGWFDGANCQVGTNPSGTSPFIYQGAYYLASACSKVTGTFCQKQPVAAAGEQTTTPCSSSTASVAESKARDQWSSSVEKQFGKSYADFKNASNPAVSCQQTTTSLGCTATCLVSAIPCRVCRWEYSDLNNAGTNVAGDLAADIATEKIFYRSSQRHLNAIYWQNGKWNYSDLNRAATNVAGDLVVDSTSKVFYRSTQGHLNAIYWQNGKWNYSDLNRAATNVAGDLVADSTNKVFYRSTQGHLNAIYWQNGRWNYSDLNRAATNVAGDLVADSTGKVFYRSTQGHLNAIYWQNGRWNYSDLNKAATNVAGDLVTDSTDKVYYRSTSGELNAIYWQNGKWNYSDLNKAATNVSGGLAGYDGSKVFYLGRSGRLDAIFWDCPK
jgi:hypothetical protein